MLLSLVVLSLLTQSSLAKICPGLGEFLPEGPFDGWPDPTCPGETGLDLIYTMFTTGQLAGEDLDRNTVPPNFNNQFDTIFLIHGWSGDGSRTEWMYDVKDSLVNDRDVNVIIVGWGGPEGAEDFNYFRSASDTRTVGAETAEVMINLINNGGGDLSRFHVSGHSLGAHVTGHAGRWAVGQGFTAAKCTGLDPAGPFFINNTDRTVGIWNDCAQFVQIIHTDQSLGSTPNPEASDVFLGHQDFFVNGGIDQPGCGSNGCDHSFAYEVFDASVTFACHVADQICDNSADIPGSCRACIDCPLCGVDASAGPTGRFYLPTSGIRPYCP